MFKGLVISAILALGIAVGGSQQDRMAAIPDTAPTTVAGTTATNAPVLPAPTAVENAAATESDPPSGQPRAGRVPRRGRGFVPLDNPMFLAAHETEYFGDEELVLGVEFAGEVGFDPVVDGQHLTFETSTRRLWTLDFYYK